MFVLLFGVAAAAPLTADEAVQASLARAVQVAEAEAALETSVGQVRATGLLTANPTVAGSVAALGDALQVSISQPISLTGEGLAARQAAQAQVDGAEAALQRARLEVAAEVRRVWVQAVEARQRSLLASDAVALAARLRADAEARLEAGEGSLLDARLARLEDAEAVATWMSALADDGARTATLAALVGVPVDAVELPDDPLAGAPLPGEGSERSDLVAARHGVEAARAGLAAERAAVVPPVALGAYYEQEEEEVRAGPSVSWTVPLWQRNGAGRAAARAELHVAEARLGSLERIVGAEQAAGEQVLRRLTAAAERLDADVPEEARAALQSVAVGYETGELTLVSAALLRTEILQGQRAWLQGRRILAEARLALLLAREDPALLRPR